MVSKVQGINLTETIKGSISPGVRRHPRLTIRSTGSSCIQNKGVAQTINKPSGSPIHRYPHDPRGAIAPEELPVGTTRPRAALQTTAAPPLPIYWASSAMNWKPTYTGIPMTRIRYYVSVQIVSLL
ncbi:hypothetical protein CDAR_66541 [Caerostris darwini]|uniref:Uncharacterized protein n=1 Tax=Caerostris darwini TaxID=1538125 RepID=A0AAV4X2G9_9ARAC|nr:hypothetical protein CDAR_66541 [Caerostris darwini]